MKPNEKNFCGGNFQDWLEVNLTEKCNGKCPWCIEKDGYHPASHADWDDLARKIMATGKTNIILLGGEPTLFKYLKGLIDTLVSSGRKVYITTNGSNLNTDYICSTLPGISGINISIHDSNLNKNEKITGVKIVRLQNSIGTLHRMGAKVRLNCNCIAGHVDSEAEIHKYIGFAESVGADNVRFAELKNHDDFVDLAKILDHKHGLNDDPFREGCHSDAVILGMPVSFRQLCGLQTPKRKKPENPELITKQVLYYDGKLYDGWKKNGEKGDNMTISKIKKLGLKKLLEDVKLGAILIDSAVDIILAEMNEEKPQAQEVRTAPTASPSDTGGAGCHY